MKSLFNYSSDKYLDLLQWFTDDAAKIKDRMWTVASFFYTLLGGMLGLIANYFVSNKARPLSIEITQPVLIVMIAIVGFILSLNGMFMIREYGKHIRSGWNRANYIRFRIEGLSEIWCFDDAERIKEDEALRLRTDNQIPSVAIRLIMLMGFFALALMAVITLVLIQ